MAGAGADIIVCHLGLTAGGSIGAQTALKLEDCPALLDAWAAAALTVQPDAIIVLVHGGPVANPADADFIMKNTRHCHGFYGASSMERLPVEVAMTEQTRKFKAISRAERVVTAIREEQMSGQSDRSAHSLADRRDHRDRHRRLLVNWLYRRSSKEVGVRPHRSSRRESRDQWRRLRAAVHP